MYCKIEPSDILHSHPHMCTHTCSYSYAFFLCVLHMLLRILIGTLLHRYLETLWRKLSLCACLTLDICRAIELLEKLQRSGEVPPQKLQALQRVLQSEFCNAVREVSK